MGGLPPTTLIDEALPSTQMDELLLFTLTSSPLSSDGRAPTIHMDELFPQFRWTSSYHSFGRALPSVNMDELLLLTSSSLNSDGRAPTIHTDDPFAALQTDGLPPTNYIDEALLSAQMDELLLFILTKLFPQLRWTSSYYSL